MQLATKKIVLSDDSIVFDVVVSDDSAWPAPSEESAVTAADVLNEVIEGFGLYNTDRQVAALGTAIRAALHDVLDT